MVRYRIKDRGTGINDVANLVTLRADVHCCLDDHIFVLYPLQGNTYLAYVLRRGFSDYAELLHRRPVTLPQRVSAEFVYARFAYTVINLLQSSCFDEFPIPDEVLLAEKMRLSEKKMKTAARKRKEPKLGSIDGEDTSTYFVS